jgi:hypothetical protein
MDAILYNGYSWIRNILHPPPYAKQYRNRHYRFLNSGMIFGEIHALEKVLTQLLDEHGALNHKSDQHYYHDAHTRLTNDIEVDYQKHYFLNIYPFKHYFERFQTPPPKHAPKPRSP